MRFRYVKAPCALTTTSQLALWGRVVTHVGICVSWFSNFTSFMIAINAIYMGLDSDLNKSVQTVLAKNRVL